MTDTDTADASPGLEGLPVGGCSCPSWSDIVKCGDSHGRVFFYEGNAYTLRCEHEGSLTNWDASEEHQADAMALVGWEDELGEESKSD